MISWLLYSIANFIFMIIAYLTNPIIVLFADEYGNLPEWAKWWGTEDNCLDVGWMISEGQVLKPFRYNFDAHYVYHLEDKSNGMIPGYVDLINPNFTTKERIQRYFCRVSWLYRNAGYGFAYYVCGRSYDPKKNIVVSFKDNGKDDYTWISYIDDDKPWWNRTWCIYWTKPWCKWCYFRVYAGWKLKGNTNGVYDIAMLAFHFTFTRLRKYV